MNKKQTIALLTITFAISQLSAQTISFEADTTAYYNGFSVGTTPYAEQISGASTVADIAIGDSWKFENVATGIDAILTINGISGNADSYYINSGYNGYDLTDGTGNILQNVYGEQKTPDPDYNSAMAIAFSATNYTEAAFEFSLSFVNSADSTAANISSLFTVLDLDTSNSGAVETLGLLDSQITQTGMASDSPITDLGTTLDGYHSFEGSSDIAYAQQDVESYSEQSPISVEFAVEDQSTLNFKWSISRDNESSNTRTFYLSGISEFDHVPEPSTTLLTTIAGLFFLTLRRKK